ncbi:MAG: hypothetical protein WC859_01440 [Elusimicrobiota bacterium]|jgi:hypothetical protein
MARYWVYLNDHVVGPFDVEQLIRLRGFSRQTQVCIDDHSGKPGTWISSFEIPELAHIFKAAGEWSESIPAPAPIPRQAPKPPVSRPVPRPAPAMIASRHRQTHGGWLWLIPLLAVLAAGGWAWFRYQDQRARRNDQILAQQLVETTLLPKGSLYGCLRDYLAEKRLQRRWDFERTPTGLWNASVSVYGGPSAMTLYAFEVNLQAQTVRPLNTAAAHLLAEGFRSPVSTSIKKPPSPPAPSPVERSKAGLTAYQKSIEKGDFAEVWRSFSDHKRSEMLKAGISQDGFVRVQSLTHGLESGLHYTLLKTKQESEKQILVLWRQSQPNHPDLFLKQLWVFENDEWKLEDEQKRSAETTPSPAAKPPSSNQAPSPSKQPLLSLPGLSN